MSHLTRSSKVRQAKLSEQQRRDAAQFSGPLEGEEELIAADAAYEARKDSECKSFGQAGADRLTAAERPSELARSAGWDKL